MDKCLLCELNNSTQTNSHIFSKFLSTDFLNNNGKRKGFSFNSQANIIKKDKKISIDNVVFTQDSPKESYILCSECETYFGLIEKASRNTFILWREKIISGEFESLPSLTSNNINIVKCTTSNPLIIKLFVYSLFWRSSISSNEAFIGFNIFKTMENDLRLLLLIYKSKNYNELKIKTDKLPSTVQFPFLIMTSEKFEDPTANYLLALPHDEPYGLIADKFSFILFKDSNTDSQRQFKQFSNFNPNDCHFVVLSPDFWKVNFNNLPAELFLKNKEM